VGLLFTLGQTGTATSGQRQLERWTGSPGSLDQE
jgi:hypothetical protein